jgi:glycosyltransferase involved in cell wall biosynthesis
MRITAILGVKDERDLLPDCIGHLRRIGVGRIEAIDTGSTDGSIEWLEARRGDGDVGLHHFSDVDPDAMGWARLNSALAEEADADWVFFLDADEFWIPASGRLADCEGFARTDVLNVHRFNIPLGPRGLLTADGMPPRRAEDVELVARPVPDFRARLDDADPTPWIRGVPMHKVAARPAHVGLMDDGGHEVFGHEGLASRTGWARDLLIAHVPFTTLSRFARKVANIRKVFEVHDEYFGTRLAWHWRRWLALDGEAAVASEFSLQAFDADALARLRADGTIRTARSLFDEWSAAP